MESVQRPRSLLEGVFATAIVLIERGGGTVPAPSEQPETGHQDVHIGLDGPAAHTTVDRLAERVAE